jgi:hypothetical protein
MSDCTSCVQKERALRDARIRYGYARAAGLRNGVSGLGQIYEAAAGVAAPVLRATPPRHDKCYRTFAGGLLTKTGLAACNMGLIAEDRGAHPCFDLGRYAANGWLTAYGRQFLFAKNGCPLPRAVHGLGENPDGTGDLFQATSTPVQPAADTGPNYMLWAAGVGAVGLVLYFATKKKGRR